MNKRTNEQKSPCVLKDFVPFEAAAQKTKPKYSFPCLTKPHLHLENDWAWISFTKERVRIQKLFLREFWRQVEDAHRRLSAKNLD